MRDCFKTQKFPLLLTGDVGSGKSTFAALIHRDYRDRRFKPSFFLKAAGAAADLKTAEFGGVMIPGCAEPLTGSALLRRWCELAGLLVIDDLTNGVLFDFGKQALWRIIDARANRPLVLTANGTPDHVFAWLGESAADRIRQGTVIVMSGESHRSRGFEDRVFA